MAISGAALRLTSPGVPSYLAAERKRRPTRDSCGPDEQAGASTPAIQEPEIESGSDDNEQAEHDSCGGPPQNGREFSSSYPLRTGIGLGHGRLLAEGWSGVNRRNNR